MARSEISGELTKVPQTTRFSNPSWARRLIPCDRPSPIPTGCMDVIIGFALGEIAPLERLGNRMTTARPPNEDRIAGLDDLCGLIGRSPFYWRPASLFSGSVS